MVQQCVACGIKRHRPAAGCYRCGASESLWTEVPGRGSIYTYCVVERAFHPAFVEDVPYVVALIEIDDQSCLRFLSRIIDCDPAIVAVGMPVDVVFADAGNNIVLPYWAPVAANGSSDE